MYPIVTAALLVLDWRIGSAVIPGEAGAMGNLYRTSNERTSNEAKTLEIEDTDREGQYFPGAVPHYLPVELSNCLLY